MHTFGGLARIKQDWITYEKFYKIYPLNNMKDYIGKGKNTNFTALTYLR